MYYFSFSVSVSLWECGRVDSLQKQHYAVESQRNAAAWKVVRTAVDRRFLFRLFVFNCNEHYVEKRSVFTELLHSLKLLKKY